MIVKLIGLNRSIFPAKNSFEIPHLNRIIGLKTTLFKFIEQNNQFKK
jgi:hypothetical protein